MNYPVAVRACMVRRMTGPQRVTATALAEETGIPQPTLSAWLRKATESMASNEQAVDAAVDRPAPTPASARRPQDISALERAQLVVGAAGLQGEARGAFLRQHGIHEAHLQGWSEALGANKSRSPAWGTGALGARVRELERELLRKDRALAEAAALIVLKKKAAMLFGEDEAPSTTRNNGP